MSGCCFVPSSPMAFDSPVKGWVRPSVAQGWGEGVLWCFVLLSHRLSRTSLGNQHPLKDTTGEMARRTGSASVGLLTSSGLLVYRATTSSLKNPCTSGVKTLWCFTLLGERRIIMDSNSADCLCNLMWSARNSQVHVPNSNCRIRRVFLGAGDRFGSGARTKAQGRQGISRSFSPVENWHASSSHGSVQFLCISPWPLLR